MHAEPIAALAALKLASLALHSTHSYGYEFRSRAARGKLDSTHGSVRCAKAQSFSRCEPCPATVAPAGSNRSSRGGNETVEAFDVTGSVGAPRACRP
jgi:hypothetical protein